MPSLTIRNIPDDLMARLRTRAAVERRSLNGEILTVIENGMEREAPQALRRARPVSTTVQLRLWEELCGRWTDKRGWKQIAGDIVRRRTLGRKVAL